MPLCEVGTYLCAILKRHNLLLLGARFEFTLDEDLKVAAACDDVKDALAAKISRERIGTEVHYNSSISSLEITWNVISKMLLGLLMRKLLIFFVCTENLVIYALTFVPLTVD